MPTYHLMGCRFDQTLQSITILPIFGVITIVGKKKLWYGTLWYDPTQDKEYKKRQGINSSPIEFH